MSLSIVVTSYKNPELLRLCLDSIKKNVLAENSQEILVIDSATEEETAMMMREDYPEIKFFPFEKNVGFQALIRKGIEESRGEFILFLNGDILVNQGAVEKMVGCIQGNPKIGMLGPKLLNFNGTFQDSCFRFYRPMTIVYRRTFLGRFSFAKKQLDWFLMKDYDHKSSRKVDWLMGSAMLISRQAAKKVGPMDSRFFMYMEDVDWCRRFWENGFEVVYFPEATMHHYHGKVSGKKDFIQSIFLDKYTWIHIASGIKYFLKYWGKPTPHYDQ